MVNGYRGLQNSVYVEVLGLCAVGAEHALGAFIPVIVIQWR